MRKVKTHKGYVIAVSKDGYYHVFTKDEWSMPAAMRVVEWEAGSLEEAVEWIG